MDACTLRALNVTATCSPRAGFAERSFFYGQTLRLPNARKYPFARRVKFLEFRAPSSAKFRVSTIEAASKGINPKEEDLAFVAGATGKVGSRAVRELLKLGFRVRAGVRSAKKAEGLVQSVKQMKLDGDKDGVQPVEKLELVECDLEKPNQILPALGNASVVLSCIGASEKEIFDVTGPYRIDYLAAKNLIDAATSAKVNHFLMVSSLGTNKFGFPAAILNLFWGVLCWKRKAEEALIASGIPYTIVRPGGMERPTDAYKLTHNIALSEEDTLFGGQVSTLQVAELMAVMAKNRSLSYCKVVEVIAETTAPLTPMEQLLAKIPSQRPEPPKLEVSDAVASSVSSPDTAALSEPQSTPIDKATTITEPIATTAFVSSDPPSTLTDKEATITEPPATTASVSSEPPSTLSDKEATITEPPATRPLSPYAAYEDLKPPASPSPLPPITPKQSEEVSPPDSEVAASSVSDTETTEEITPSIDPAEAKSTEVVKPQPLSPYTAYDDLKPPSSPSPVPSGPKEVTSGPAVTEETSGPLVVTEESVEEPATTEEITPSIDPTEAKSTEVVKPQPLSPYTAYDDLKPPSSPSPVSSGPKEVTSSPAVTEETSVPLVVTEEPVEEPQVGGNGVAVLDDDVKEDPPKDSTSYRSPYFVYDDFKPPSSPSPSSPPPPPPPSSASSILDPPSDSNGAAKPLEEEEAVAPTPTDEPSITADNKKPTPLSPYAMYEDLKPPTSPTPSPSSS